jgi:hypothetical protein
MPGTKNFSAIKPAESNAALVELIQQSLMRRRNHGDAEQAFVVEGEVDSALRQVYDVLVKRERSNSQISVGDKAWIVFFTYSIGQFVHLKEVLREGHNIKIRYRLIPHSSKNLTRHLALIPIEALPSGTYKVDIVSTPLEAEFVASNYVAIPESALKQRVCRPFNFSVVDP